MIEVRNDAIGTISYFNDDEYDEFQAALISTAK